MADEIGGLVRVTKANYKPAAATLAKAFLDYPVSVYFIPDDKKRRKQQYRVYRMIVRGAIASGEVYGTSSKMESAAIWMLGDSRLPPQKRRYSIGWRLVDLFADKETIRRQRIFMEYSNAVKARVVPGKYLYLQMLGVDSEYRGKGFSSRLLRPMLERADREGLPCFLETQLKKNVPLYEHFGFKVVEEGLVPGSNLYSWSMVREPGKIEIKNQISNLKNTS